MIINDGGRGSSGSSPSTESQRQVARSKTIAKPQRAKVVGRAQSAQRKLSRN